MSGVKFYRDMDLPVFELKLCNTRELSYKKHAHEEYSLGVVEQGEGFFWHDGKLNKIYPQAMVLFPPAMIHACNPDPRSCWQYRMLFVNADWVHRFMEAKGCHCVGAPGVRYAPESSAFITLCKLLTTLASKADPLEKEASMIAVFEQIMLDEAQPYENSRQGETKLSIIKEYLHSCFLEKITLDQLERLAEINKYHIIRLFKEAYMIPPHAYQTLLRINYAKKELRKRRPVTEVAMEAGFYDQSHFIKAFKCHVGVTPNKYLGILH